MMTEHHRDKDEEHSHHRRKADIAIISVLITMFVQFGGIVWGAAKLTAGLDEISRIVGRLEMADSRRTTSDQELAAWRAGIEIRVQQLERISP